MNTKQIWQILGGGAVIFALVVGLSVYTNRVPVPRGETAREAPQTSTISLSVEGLYIDSQVPISSGDTVLEVLQVLDAEDSQLQLSTKEYPGVGILVDGMHGIKNGDGNKYWQYKVNGVMPQIGADVLELKNGDSVEWFFDISEF